MTFPKARATGAAGLALAVCLLWPSSGEAQPFRHRPVRFAFAGGFYDPFFFGPFAGPYAWGYGFGPYPYGAYGAYGPYGPYGRTFELTADARLLVTPKQAAVYVDGYRAGKVDDFDGAFQRLHLRPGPHEITLFLDGYRTVREKLYLNEGSTVKIREALVPLAAGEKSEPPPAPAPRRKGGRGGDAS